MQIDLRPAEPSDLPALTDIYNYYVLNTPVTFDSSPFTVEKRRAWLDQFSPVGRHRLIVAEIDGILKGYAGTTRFRPKPCYDTTVETTVYCAPDAKGLGLGTRLYTALFDAVANEDIHRIVAGYAMPNDASAKLHARFGFKQVGVFTQNGRKFDKFWDVMWLERPLKL